MADLAKIEIDDATARLVSALATVVTGNLIAVLRNRRVIDDADIAEVVEMTRHGGVGQDASIQRLSGHLADMLAEWARPPRN